MADSPEKSEGAVSLEDDKISNAFQKILENPEIISTVAAALGMPAPTKDESSKAAASLSDSGNTNALAAIAPLLSPISKKSSPSEISTDQACLLRALKPYVSQSRCEAIDYIIKITEISQLLKKIN